MKTIKEKYEIIYLNDEDLKFESNKTNRPCILLNDYEEDNYGIIVPLTTQKIPDYAQKESKIIQLSIRSNLVINQGVIKVTKEMIDYSESAHDKLQLSNDDIKKIKKIKDFNLK